MHTVEGAGQNEIIIDREFIQAVVEVALVDKATGFVDDYEGVDDPV